ncbi:MAG: hypothetical protein QF463_02840 [Vicinamibacterales bacterium]|nr:hypothetical protein [Vicinamibacterales bacterium]
MRIRSSSDARGGRWGLTLGASVLAFGVALAVPAAAQVGPTPTGGDLDPRWLPWMGCWQLDTDVDPLGDADAGERSVVTCLRPADDGAVEMAAFAGGAPAFSRSIRADAYRYPIEEPACRGWHVYRWATAAPRLYSRAELRCEDGASRTISGMSVVALDGGWLDIQFVGAGEPSALTIRRYRRASDLAAAAAGAPSLPPALAARTLAAAAQPTTWTVEDVVEASTFVEGPVLEAAIYETGDEFDLDADALVALDDAGVSDDVIDLMVALTYPDRFDLEPQPTRDVARDYGIVESRYQSDRFDRVELYSHYAAPFGHYYAWTPYDHLYLWGPVPYGYSSIHVSYGWGPRWRYGYGGYYGGYYGGNYGGGYGNRTYRGTRPGVGPRPGRGNASVVSPRGYTRRPAVPTTRPGGGAPPTERSRTMASPSPARGGTSGGVRRAKPRNPPSGSTSSASRPSSGGSRSGVSGGGGRTSPPSRGVSRQGYRRRPPSR